MTDEAPRESPVRTSFYWFATIFVLVNLPKTVQHTRADPGVYRPGFAPAVITAMGVLGVIALVQLILRRRPRWAMAGLVAVSCVALAAHPFVMLRSDEYPPLLHVLGAGMTISAIVGVRTSLVVIPLFATGAALLRIPEVGAWGAAQESLLLALGGFVGTAFVDNFVRADRSVRDAVRQVWQAVEENARSAQRVAARDLWDGLVHDKVLGALSIASRAPGPEVPAASQALAQDALAALRGEHPLHSPAAEQWQSHADRLGLDARIVVHGHLTDATVREALVGAVNEVLTNVARHSGQQAVEVSGSLVGDRFQITVVDTGTGFDPSQATHGMGLRVSVLARLRSIDGEVELRSAPGEGTAVVLTRGEVSSPSGRTAVDWQLQWFVPIALVAWALLAVVLLVSYPAWSTAPVPALAVLTVLAAVVLTAVATFVTPTRNRAVAIGVAAAVITLVGVLNTHPDAILAWRYWYLSALTPAFAATSYRFSRWSGTWAVGVATTIVLVVDASAGRSMGDVLITSVPVMTTWVVGSQLVRNALSRAWSTVESAEREETELRLALAAEVERATESASRIAELEASVVPTLERLAAGTPLAEGSSEQLDLLSSAVRDHLRAPGLFGVFVADDLYAARSRGVVVDIVTGGTSAGSSDEECLPCGSLLRVLLAHAEPGLHVRVSWWPSDRRRSTVAAVGPGLEGLTARLTEEIARLGVADHLAVTSDGEAMLVETVDGPADMLPGRGTAIGVSAR